MKHNALIANVLLFSILLFCGKTSLAQHYADCDSAYWVGTTYAIHFIGPAGIGADSREADNTPCFMNGLLQGQAEANSTWLRFDIDQPGKLKFTIIPDDLTNDYDFVLYQLPANGRCSEKKIVRCIAAGSSVYDPKNPCMGITGLREKSKDKKADAGCSDIGDDAWLAAVPATAGENYVLLVSNTTAPYQGFTIRFNGDCTFKK